MNVSKHLNFSANWNGKLLQPLGHTIRSEGHAIERGDYFELRYKGEVLCSKAYCTEVQIRQYGSLSLMELAYDVGYISRSAVDKIFINLFSAKDADALYKQNVKRILYYMPPKFMNMHLMHQMMAAHYDQVYAKKIKQINGEA